LTCVSAWRAEVVMLGIPSAESDMTPGNESNGVVARLDEDFARVIVGDEQRHGDLATAPRGDVVWVVDGEGRIRASLASDAVTGSAI